MGRLLTAEGFLVAIPLILASLAGCEPVRTPKATPIGGVEEPTEVLRKAATFIEAQKAFGAVIDVEMRIEAQGQKAEVMSAYLLSVARPDRLALRLQDGDNGVSLVTDGQQFWRGVPGLKKYVVSESPASVSEVFKDKSAALMGMGIGGAFFDALLSEHVYDRLMEKVTGSHSLGIEKIGGDDCQHLRFDQSEYDGDVWIETGAHPFIRKVAFQIKKLPGGGGQETPDIKLSLSYQFHDWNLNKKFSEETFAFSAPEGWDKVDDLSEETEPPHPLLGKPAPEFQLEKRGGGTVESKEFQHKVVILDFWATWCPPCVKALPTIAKVAEEYRDRGVLFYAVDLGETPDEVEKFLTEQKLDIPVVFDTDTAVAKLYQVAGIPQTVLIGKDGTVQVVHVGLMPNLEKLLSDELDDLVAGKDLAGEDHKSGKDDDSAKDDEPVKDKEPADDE
jgi:peroxiredoxin